jgi:hypothetical protein
MSTVDLQVGGMTYGPKIAVSAAGNVALPRDRRPDGDLAKPQVRDGVGAALGVVLGAGASGVLGRKWGPG